MSPATPNPRARCTRERRHPRPAALAPARERAHRLGRGRPPRRPLPTRGRTRPRPRRLLPPLRVRRLAAERRIVMSRNKATAIATWRPAWAAGAPRTGRPQRSAGSRSSSSPSLSAARSGRRDRPEHDGAGRVRPHGQDSRRRLQAARRRKRPDPEPLAATRAIPLSQPRSRTSSRASRQVAFRTSVRRTSGNAGEIAKDGHAALVEFDIRGDKRQGGRQDRSGPRPRRRGAAGPPAVLHRRVRRRQRCEGHRHGVRQRPGEGRPVLDPDHADHPRDRVRSAGRRRHPAAARADRGLRDVRADRAAQPPAADAQRRRPRWCC